MIMLYHSTISCVYRVRIETPPCDWIAAAHHSFVLVTYARFFPPRESKEERGRSQREGFRRVLPYLMMCAVTWFSNYH